MNNSVQSNQSPLVVVDEKKCSSGTETKPNGGEPTEEKTSQIQDINELVKSISQRIGPDEFMDKVYALHQTIYDGDHGIANEAACFLSKDRKDGSISKFSHRVPEEFGMDSKTNFRDYDLAYIKLHFVNGQILPRVSRNTFSFDVHLASAPREFQLFCFGIIAETIMRVLINKYTQMWPEFQDNIPEIW